MGKKIKHPDTYHRKREIERRINVEFERLKESSDPFNERNTKWKAYCYRMKQIQKLTAPNPFALENWFKNENKA